MRWLVVVSALVVAAAGGSGCAENDQSIVIQRFAASEDPMGCMLSASGMVSISRGSMYPVAGTASVGYFLAPAVLNLLPTRGTMSTAEPNGVIMKGFDVELQGSTAAVDAAIPSNERKQRIAAAGGYLAPGGTSISISTIEAVSPATRRAVLATLDPASLTFPQLNVRIRPVGTQGGLELVGGYVTFAIDLCSEVLVGSSPNTCFPTQDQLCVIPQ
jgi:hypothetical protein